ncbi:putative mitochondrial carrier protein [Kalaharituber pfeilii]|nr:putative mitochondrial carrier protein [Kalaharituber pfeilii]
MPDLASQNERMVMTTAGAPDRLRQNPPRIATRSQTDAIESNRRKNKQSLDYVLRNFVAGGVAGCAAKTLIAPLDRVKILFQASNPQFLKYTGSWLGVVDAVKDIRQHEGFFGLYKGHSATLLRIFPYAAIKFVAYEQVRAILIKSEDQETPARRFLSGSLAGVTSVLFTYPLEVIRVRLAFETKRDRRSGLVDICKKIYMEAGYTPAASKAVPAAISATPHQIRPLAGLSNFYRGFFPTVLGMLPYAGVSFLTHDLIGDWLRKPGISKYTTISRPAGPHEALDYDGNRKVVLKVWAELLSGGLAGLCSQTASYPLEVIRRRMQVSGAVGNGKFLRIGETAATIWRTNGFRGFFVGLSIGYVKIIPMTATAFFVYERSKLYLGI